MLIVNDVYRSEDFDYFEGLLGLRLPTTTVVSTVDAVSTANAVSTAAFTCPLVFGNGTCGCAKCIALKVYLADFFVFVFMIVPIVSFKICSVFPFKLDWVLTSSFSKSLLSLRYS